MVLPLTKQRRKSTSAGKANILKRYVEDILTKTTKDTTNSRRVVFSMWQNKDAVTELIR